MREHVRYRRENVGKGLAAARGGDPDDVDATKCCRPDLGLDRGGLLQRGPSATASRVEKVGKGFRQRRVSETVDGRGHRGATHFHPELLALQLQRVAGFARRLWRAFPEKTVERHGSDLGSADLPRHSFLEASALARGVRLVVSAGYMCGVLQARLLLRVEAGQLLLPVFCGAVADAFLALAVLASPGRALPPILDVAVDPAPHSRGTRAHNRQEDR
mmetsp:Transcript_107635/g.303148  ORF Transcript_107635/g.303148 Transcript_107635/m.303148 type:complete len:217 (+) Transcript_107635:1748-2398(+)